MGPRPTEVPVDDNHGHEDTDGVHNKGEEQVFSYERQHQRSRRQDFADQQKEHNQRQENTNAQGNLLAGLRWQIEDEHAEEGDQNRRQYQVYRVEEGFPAKET